MTVMPFGDSSLLINFEQKIDPGINAKVMALYQKLQDAKLPGISFLTPAYCSLTLGFDQYKTNYQFLKKQITELGNQLADTNQTSNRKLTIPVCYERAFALDQEEICEKKNLDWSEIISLHTSQTYQVYMLGFLPGFAYMGTLPNALHCSRKSSPRLKVPPRSVAIAGGQTGIYPSVAPGGWQVIGQTPIEVFRTQMADPFLIKTGDKINFKAIDSITFEKIRDEVNTGHFNWEALYV